MQGQRSGSGTISAACQATFSNNTFAFPSITNRASCSGFDRATAVISCTKSKTLSGGRPSSASIVSTIRPASAFENPRLREASPDDPGQTARRFSRAPGGYRR
tara:strand:+ start:205 stop:513 length:309 start_codon:yes stop_codon:yes gene_type:complete